MFRKGAGDIGVKTVGHLLLQGVDEKDHEHPNVVD